MYSREKQGISQGLISRAIDENFTFIIVLSGILNDLRRQTQLRLHKDVFGTAGIKARTAKSHFTPKNSSVSFSHRHRFGYWLGRIHDH